MKLHILGTAAQLPTKSRSQNAYFLEWMEEGILFDPGEGAQRQFTLAGISPGRIRRIFISHFHGDHCLGLPGILQRLSLMEVPQTVKIYFPEEGADFFHALENASQYTRRIEFEVHPLKAGLVEETGTHRIECVSLDHSTPVLGYRLTLLPQERFDPDQLARYGLEGPAVGELEQKGSLDWKGEHLTREALSYRTKEKVFAYVLDTGACEAVPGLVRNADCVLMEATYLESEQVLADAFRHMTAEQAARYARDNGVQKLVLTHYSERYKDLNIYQKAVENIFKNTHIAQDFDEIEF
ncbi:MAG: MBL fold metallo-hydrolase [Candidatus Marinimicrobia bacterium]|nr:MBL fold metallo-hydrolase [Candidatus Neomarinimicrobiota bacterium]